MPMRAGGAPVSNMDAQWLGLFSYHTGLIAICWTLVVMSMFSFFTYLEYMIAVEGGGALVVFGMAFLLSLADGAVSGALLLGLSDGTARARLSVWLLWNVVYSLVVLLLICADLSAVVVVAGIGVLSGLRTPMAIGFRLLCIWTGWMYQNSLQVSAPPPARHH
ncbi:uncharacterized protein LOC122371978 [Amphibalanus amphitrite]|uniref:uncharacterized protein LOC122371978 n=1 Tax=Amphibalanus amphitrite TaxID=1232801 RepID=UPI001C926605|nr:uncharacterized protein LOC122371978 [Amphibalanus amphitrite]